MSNDPRQALREGSMTSFQVVVVIICVVLNMVDGFDVLAMSFTAPLVAREWGVDPATLGVLLSGPAGSSLSSTSSCITTTLTVPSTAVGGSYQVRFTGSNVSTNDNATLGTVSRSKPASG